ncbi:glycine cleavage system aminomethyltransferase GcvT [Novosphingobium aerophilum]|uniref:glycine cleavage system aminomethyltransferase GcvT n=1 Tax=Novosphingobium TaxID=165696 RepID=UPI0017D016C0|nr:MULTISPECIES: glycine cleavage system aminomethyltransferase GcvT [unclassified Novosphingobium]WRT91501.1 glycine cleavage system aminomethyltransferase GcvT [Novosphingobium sp. RL4]
MSEYPISDSDQEEAPPAPLLLPLDGWHRERGGRMVEFAGYIMPVQYEGIMAEHLWTRESAGLFDVSHMGQLYISGEGVEAALETALPIDLSTLKTGSVRYSLLLDENGGILDDLMVTRWETGFYLVVNGATKWDDIGTLRELLPDDVTLNHLDDSALLALQGPKAAEALERLVPGVSALTFMKGGAFKLGGVDAWISRSGYTGEDGFEIAIPGESAAMIAELLCGEPEVKPIGLGARDSLRLEAGLPLYGHDMDPERGPVEAGLAFGINKRRRLEGGFPGAERVQRDFAQGTAQKRIGLKLEGRQAAREGAKVFHGEQEVGVVTSGGFSPSLQHPVAMAYVDAAVAADGTALSIEIRGKKLDATVAAMPFVPNRYHR